MEWSTEKFIETSDGLKLYVGETGRCPFCQGEFSLFSKDAKNLDGVLHSMPYCKKFEEEDVLVFLRNLRVAKIGVLPDDDEWSITFPSGLMKQ